MFGFWHFLSHTTEMHPGQRVVVLSPEGRGTTFDPFADAQGNFAWLKAMATTMLSPDEDRDKIFAERAVMVLATMILAAQIEAVPVLQYLEGLLNLGLRGALKHIFQLNHPDLTNRLARLTGDRWEDQSEEELEHQLLPLKDDKFMVSTWTTFSTRIEALLTPGIIAMTSGSEFKVDDFLEQPISLYLEWNESALAGSRKILELVLFSLLEGLKVRADRLGGRLPQPVLTVLEESGVVNLPSLSEQLATLRSRGVTILLSGQSIAQMRKRYGADGTDTILACCPVKVFFKAEDKQTANEMSFWAGKTVVTDKRTSSNTHGESHSEGQLIKDLLAAHEATQFNRTEVLICMDALVAREKRASARDQFLTQLTPPPVPVIQVAPWHAQQVIQDQKTNVKASATRTTLTRGIQSPRKKSVATYVSPETQDADTKVQE
jgi:type IV secretion system protein VirD4